jgi:dTDP-glucose 4,6-dehydratase/UDP-glucose 4-epimerase
VICLKALAEMLINLGYGDAYELIPFPPERKAIDIGDYYSDFSLIAKELGWEPQIGLKDGLRRTVEYYQAHHCHYWDDNV